MILKTIDEYNKNGKRTIAIFCDAYYPAVDGVIKVLENHATYLAKNNNIILCVPKHKNKLYDESKNKYLVIGINALSVSSVGYDLALPSADKNFKNIINKARIDIVHLHSPFSLGAFAVNFAKKKKIPVIGTFHSLYKQDFYKATNNKALAVMLTNIIMNVFNKCNLVLTMNPYAEKMLREYGYKGKIKLLPNSIGWTIHSDVDNEKEMFIKKYNIQKNQVVFSFIGRLVIQKQILFMADVIKRLKEKGIDSKLILIGDGVDASKLKKKIKEDGTEDNFIFTGILKDERTKSALLGISKLFMFPSTYDTDGIVKIEAACMKVPTICVENTGVASSITDNVNGYISELDVEIFTNRIIEILKNEELRKQVGENAYKDLYLTWDEIVTKLEEYYTEEIANMTIKRLKNARKYKNKK